MNPYSKKVINHFKNPHNFVKMKKPDGEEKVGNVVCGDVMWLYIKIGKDKKGREIIKDIKFEAYGCVAALATSSVITDLAKGKTLKVALKIDKKKVVKSLGWLPAVKIHCSVLATEALAEAVHDYLSKSKKKVPENLRERHERIQKGLKIIKRRYKQYNELEKKILEKNN